MKSEKINEINILRAFAALAVITIHTTAYFTKISELNFLKLSMAYLDFLSGFAVPTFFFISAMVLYKNYNNLNEKKILFYKKRFLKIIPVYVLFSFFYMILIEIMSYLKKREYNFDFIKIIFNLFTGGAYYHLWFFCSLFQFYLLYPFFLKLYQKFKIKFLIFSLIVQFLFSFKGIIFEIYKINFNLIPIFIDEFFYFVLGFYFLENKEKILNKINLKIIFILMILLNLLRMIPIYYGLKTFELEMIPKTYYLTNNLITPFLYLVQILFFYKISLNISKGKNNLEIIFSKIGF